MDLSLPDKSSSFYLNAVSAIVGWAQDRQLAGMISIDKQANRYVAEAAGDESLRLPYVSCTLRRQSDTLLVLHEERGGAAMLESRVGPVGIVHDVRTTGLWMLRCANLIKGPKEGLALVDRGVEVPGVDTPDEVQEYKNDHPDRAAPHIRLPFNCIALVEYPLALYGPPNSAKLKVTKL